MSPLRAPGGGTTGDASRTGGPRLPSLAELERAAAVVYAAMPPTPQYSWPLLSERVGCEVWVKHENHTPIGSFKVRGGLVYLDHLARDEPETQGVISATRGNHGQSIAFAARRHGLRVAVVVPAGNSVEKNAAMRALGVELIEQGVDFQSAAEAADVLARERAWHRLPSFHPLLVAGVGTYALEFLRAAPPLDTVYVPIGLGSGICGMLAARDALGLKTEIVGVVSAGAPAYARSLAAGHPVSHPVLTDLADGLACRTPVPEALALIARGTARVVEVADAEVARGMRALFTDTHNVAEGAGAAGLAAALADTAAACHPVSGPDPARRIGIVLSGGNVDRDVFARTLTAL